MAAKPLSLVIPGERSQKTLVDWADETFLSNVPAWAIRLLSTTATDVVKFHQRRILHVLFSARSLRGVDTTLEEFVDKGGIELARTIPDQSFGWKIVNQLVTHVQRTTGITCETDINKAGHRIENWPKSVLNFRQHLESIGRAKKTVKEHSYIAMAFVRWLPTLRKFAGVKPENINIFQLEHEDIVAYLQYLTRRVRVGEMTECTACQTSAVTLSFVRYCEKRLGRHDLVRDLKGLPQGDIIDMWLPSEQEIHEFFKTVTLYSPTPLMHISLFGMMYCHGLRPVEALGIEWEHVDLESGTISFRAKGGEFHTALLMSPMVRALNAYKKELGHDVTGRIFLKESGAPMTKAYLHWWFRAYATIAQWPEESFPKTFRHLFCTTLLLFERDHLFVNRQARHKNLHTTQRYLHLTGENLRQPTRKIQASLRRD